MKNIKENQIYETEYYALGMYKPELKIVDNNLVIEKYEKSYFKYLQYIIE